VHAVAQAFAGPSARVRLLRSLAKLPVRERFDIRRRGRLRCWCAAGGVWRHHSVDAPSTSWRTTCRAARRLPWCSSSPRRGVGLHHGGIAEAIGLPRGAECARRIADVRAAGRHPCRQDRLHRIERGRQAHCALCTERWRALRSSWVKVCRGGSRRLRCGCRGKVDCRLQLFSQWQVCSHSPVIVTRTAHRMSSARRTFKAVKIGDPFDSGTDGPARMRRQRDRVSSCFAAVSDGSPWRARHARRTSTAAFSSSHGVWQRRQSIHDRRDEVSSGALRHPARTRHTPSSSPTIHLRTQQQRVTTIRIGLRRGAPAASARRSQRVPQRHAHRLRWIQAVGVGREGEWTACVLPREQDGDPRRAASHVKPRHSHETIVNASPVYAISSKSEVAKRNMEPSSSSSRLLEGQSAFYRFGSRTPEVVTPSSAATSPFARWVHAAGARERLLDPIFDEIKPLRLFVDEFIPARIRMSSSPARTARSTCRPARLGQQAPRYTGRYCRCALRRRKGKVFEDTTTRRCSTPSTAHEPIGG